MVLPHACPTKSYWIEEANSSLRCHRSTPELPDVVDIVIIGSGYTGTAIAYWINKFTKEHGYRPTILMLEARDVCSGATGRNGGQLRPHAYSRYSIWAERFGAETAMSLIEHEMAHLPAFEALLREESISSEEVSFKLGTTFDAAMTEDAFVRLRGALDAMKRDYGSDNEIVKACRVVEGQAAEKDTQMKGCIGAIFHPAGQIWPYKFVVALLRILLSTSAFNLQSNTAVTHVSHRDSRDELISVTTARGVVKARAVVHATNRWADHLISDLTGLITPTLATVAAVKAPEALLKYTGAQHWGGGIIYNYHLQLPPPHNTIIVGGAKAVLVNDPRSYINNDNEMEQLPGVPEYLRSWPKKSVVGWASSDDEEQLARGMNEGGCWTGVTATSSDAFPFVGALPGRPGQFLAAGFSGHGRSNSLFDYSYTTNVAGMPRILLSAAHVASLVMRSLGEEHSTQSMATEYPDLPTPFVITTERITRLQKIDVRATMEARVKLDAIAAKACFRGSVETKASLSL